MSGWFKQVHLGLMRLFVIVGKDGNIGAFTALTTAAGSVGIDVKTFKRQLRKEGPGKYWEKAAEVEVTKCQGKIRKR